MHDQAKRDAAALGSRRLRKLLKVLVMGGAVLASNCATTKPKDGNSSQGASDEGRGRGPEQGGGVQGW